MPSALRALVPWERAVELGPAELALTPEEFEDAALRAGVSADAAAVVYRATEGWPLVARLLVGLLRDEPADDIVEAATVLAGPALLAFGVQRTIARLEDVVRDALTLAGLRGGATHAELVRVLGGAFDDLAYARLCALPAVERDGERVVIHPAVVELLHARFAPLVKILYERLLDVLTGDGAYAEAARIALESGDAARAAAIVDAAPPYTAAPVSLAEYERIIERIDRGLIARYPNLWIATIPYRAFAVDRATFVREAETVYYCLSCAASAEQRAAALMLLANAYINVGRVAECDQLVDEALNGFAAAHPSARASLLNFIASVRGIEGRFELARSLASEAATLRHDSFGENQTLHYLDAHEAGYRGKIERVAVIVDELLRRRGQERLPLYLAYVASNGAFFAWVAGDDALFERYLGVMEEVLTPGIERGFAPMVDAARGRSVQIDDAYPWQAYAAIAQLYRMGRAGLHEEALDAARAAARAADFRCDPYLRILTHAALHVLDQSARPAEAALLGELVASFESAEMRAAVASLVRGEPPGILEPFVSRRVLRAREPVQPRLVLDLLAARATLDGAPVRLTDKELEFLAFVATAPGAPTRDRIGEALWDHLDPKEWPNNLKVTLSRVRSKLGSYDAVLSTDGRYRLSPAIEVDLLRAEALVRERRARPLDERTRQALGAILEAHRSRPLGRYERFAWARPMLARIHGVVCKAGVMLAEDALAQERLDEALGFAGEVASVDPYDEAACELSIRVLLARGDPDAARREFRRYAAALAEELDAKPSARLAALVATPLAAPASHPRS
jgi:DNA-binding SARP family transcriptional activator